jgi:hypothetical protein
MNLAIFDSSGAVGIVLYVDEVAVEVFTPYVMQAQAADAVY